MTSGAALPCLIAVAMMPVPSGLVSTRKSPGRAAGVGHLLAGLDQPGDRHAVLGLRVVDGVTADDGGRGLAGDLRPTLQDPAEILERQRPRGERDDVQRGERARPHRVDVGEGVGRGDAPEVVGVVDDGREEVDRLDQR